MVQPVDVAEQPRAAEVSDVGNAERHEAALSGWQYGLFLLLALAVVFSRRPQDVLHAQFYAEDGARWYAQAYNGGWLRSLTIPDASYLQVLPRLAAGVSLTVPFAVAPLVLNLLGGLLQVLPAVLLLTPLCASWGPLRVRAGMAVAWLLVPFAPEVHVNITNAQWHLAVLLVLLGWGRVPRTWPARALEVLVFLVGAVSGPFCLVAGPLLLLESWRSHCRWRLVLAGCLLSGALLQGWTMHVERPVAGQRQGVLTDANGAFLRSSVDRIPLGATPTLLVRIVGDDMFAVSLASATNAPAQGLPVAAASCVLGLIVIAFVLWTGPWAYRGFAVFTVLLTAAALRSPVVAAGGASNVGRWTAMLHDPGMRYDLLPAILLLWSCVYAIAAWRRGVVGRGVAAIGALTLLLALSGVLRRWEYAPLLNRDFAGSVQRLQAAPAGQVVIVPIPPDPSWQMMLVKR